MKLLNDKRMSKRVMPFLCTAVFLWGSAMIAWAANPAISNITVPAFDEDTNSGLINFTVSDAETAATSLLVTNISAPTILFPAEAVVTGGSGSNRTVRLTPAADRSGTENVTLRVTDGAGDTSDETFSVTVNAVEDEPVLSGITGFAATSTNADFNIFPNATITDADAFGTEFERYAFSITVGGDVGGELTGDLSSTGTLAEIEAVLTNLVYAPFGGGLPIGQTASVEFDVQLHDFLNVGDTNQIHSTQTASAIGTVKMLKDLPAVYLGLSTNTIGDNAPAKIFSPSIQIFGSSSVAVALTTPSDVGHVLGTFSPEAATFTGSPYEAEQFIKNIYYIPKPNLAESSVVTFRLTVYAGEDGTNSAAAVLTITEVNDPPLVSGISSASVFTDDATPVSPFPNALVQDPDRQGSQLVSYWVTASPTNKGSFAQSVPSSYMSQALASEQLRSGLFTPNENSVAVGETEQVTLTVHVKDKPGLESYNNQASVAINGVNGAPVIVLPPDVPHLVEPLNPRPFMDVRVSDDDNTNTILYLTITMDDSDKGTLSVTNIFPGFSTISPGVYTYTNSIAGTPTNYVDGISGLLKHIAFAVSNDYAGFPSGSYGATEFTISLEDDLGNTTTKYLQTVLRQRPRNIMVTEAEDHNAEGSLRYAISNAAPNDVVTFALPEYPAIIRLSDTNGVIELTKHINFKGPGADLLTISGDSNGDGIPNQQLFQIEADVEMEGIAFEQGSAPTGGAISVGPAGRLVLRSCIVRDSVATQWGGAIDVDHGQLILEQCLLQSNQTDASLGLGGGAVSLWTTQPCYFTNTTFAGNRQAASSGYGGGAVYAENSNPQIYLDVEMVHCTFAENRDEAGLASSVYANGAGTTIWPMNTIFSDEQGRNLEVNLGDMYSLGGNTSDDSTFSVLSDEPNDVYLLSDATDQTIVDVLLGPLTHNIGPAAVYPLTAGSPAINACTNGSNPVVAVDQRGVLRNGKPDSDDAPDCGASEFGAVERVLVNEIQMSAGTTNFIEFYVPRNALPTDLSGFRLFTYDSLNDYYSASGDGALRHIFALDTVIDPGFGIIVSDSLMLGVTNVAVVQPNAFANLELEARGVVVLKDSRGLVVLAASYNSVFKNLADVENDLSFPDSSLSLAPQFSGFAFLPHSYIIDEVFSSPGKEIIGLGTRGFGEPNAAPVAVSDYVVVGEDELKRIQVLDNDKDADGTDIIVVTGVPLSTFTNSAKQGAACQVAANAATGYGDSVWYDPRGTNTIQQLAAGAELSDSFMYRIEDVGTAAIELSSGNGTNVVITSRNHRLKNGDEVRIFDSIISNKVYTVSAATNDSFSITNAYMGSETNTGYWVAEASRGGSSSNVVNITLIGANDVPVGGPDKFSGTEEEALRLLADPDLLGSAYVFDSDAGFESSFGTAPRLGLTNLLANDDDIDTDDNTNTLTIVGVLDEVNVIQNVSGNLGDSVVTIESIGHGLVSGSQIVISGYGGHPSYNGSQVVTVLDADRFSIPVVYVDSSVVAGVWGQLDDGNRLTAVSQYGAEVVLEIRADRAESSILYNPWTSSHLNALAFGEPEEDLFYYAVSDSHGAVGLVPVVVNVTGVNELPMNSPDPDSLAVLAPFVEGTNTLGNVISGLSVLDAAGAASGTDGRADARVQVAGTTEADSVVLADVWRTTEDVQLLIVATNVTQNDSDEDTTDALRVFSVMPSMLGVAVTLVPGAVTNIVYDAPSSEQLNKLEHNEMLIDSFKAVITDDRGGFVTNDVVVLVVGVNDAPVAVADEITTLEDQPFTFTTNNHPISNDFDYDVNSNAPDNSLWLIPGTGTSLYGGAYAISNSTAFYDPSGSAFLDGIPSNTTWVDTFEYTLTDQSFIFANDDLFRVEADSAGVELSVMVNDVNYNERGGAVWISRVGIPDSGGTVGIVTNVVVSGTGTNAVTHTNINSLAYSPEVNFVGDEIFTYGIEDEWGNYSQGRVVARVTVEELNGHLQANDDFFTVALGESVQLPVLANDNTLPGSTASFVITGLSDTNGIDEIAINGSGIAFTQTNHPGSAPFTFSYEISGGGSARAEASVQVLVVDRGNKLPTQDDHFHVNANSFDNFMDVVLNDSILPGIGNLDILSISLEPANGSVTVDQDANRLLYTPQAGYFGEDKLGYKVIDGLGGTGTGTVWVTVGNPVAANDSFVVHTNDAGMQVDLDVLANDLVLPDMPASLKITDVSPSNALIEVASDGQSLLFTAESGLIGSTNFTYTVRDGNGTGSRELTAVLTVTLVADGVFGNADAFRVAKDDASVTLPVLVNDRSLLNGGDSGRKLSVISIGTGSDAPNHGGSVLIASGNQELLYTPVPGFTGEETFTYLMTDAYGTDSARVTLIVGGGIIAANDDAYAVYHEGTNTPAFTLPVLHNDAIVPDTGGLLEIVGVGITDSNATNAPTQQGNVEVAGDGQSLIYTPSTNAASSSYQETFTYELSDGTANRAFAKVTIDVLLRDADVDLSDEINDDRFTVQRNSTANLLPLLRNDGAIPSSASGWSITSASSPEQGGQVVVSGGSVVFIPLPDFVGTDRFAYSISDGFGGTAEAEVLVKVGDLMLNEDRFTVISGTASNILDVLSNDGILPGPEYELVLDGAGAFSVSTNGVHYTPGSGYAGTYPYTETFEYSVLDDSSNAVKQLVHVLVVEEGSDRSNATVSITVQGVNDLPVLSGFIGGLVMDDNTQTNIFAGASVTDVDLWGDEEQLVVIVLDDAVKGTIEPLGNFSLTGPGRYEMRDTPSAVSAALGALEFVPTENRIPGISSEVTGVDVFVSDPFIVDDPLTNHLDILVWSVNDPPVINGLVDPLGVRDGEVLIPFQFVQVEDVDEMGTQLLTASVRLLFAPRQGAFYPASLGGFTEVGNDYYVMANASPMSITTALRGLRYNINGGVSSGTSETEVFEIRVNDAFVAAPVEADVTMTIYAANAFIGSWRTAHFGSNTAIDGDNQDPDGDGLINIEEYVFGTDPMVPNDDLAHSLAWEPSPAEGTLTASHNSRADDPTLIYVLEKSTDMETWEHAGEWIVDRSTTTPVAGIQRALLSIDIDDDENCCYRLKVYY
ncbi:Ig-like domain-containing protein [Pontiella sulfatireligans]|uniref:RapA2 cadherin-like domain-containing protein n=1 Tax=Pontiella sulfatireligans TaxID=2750658 RepID=A0A6C2UKJ4_9BACT|nr:tandem-95 repeat protein [Pontiella sulfatireligans]VGO20755.1 hypothetical protein SCARR_02822 [Pontiella sulfatireligans]